MKSRSLPIVDNGPREIGHGSLGRDGRRHRPYPADVGGRFVRARRAVYALLIAVWALLPWIPIAGRPAVFLDIERRRFFLFGATFNAQDLWLVFFAVTGVGFGLVYATALLGRVFCGWACPQTVFIEALFRPIERLVNGPRNTALRRARGPATFDRAVRKVVTHALYVLAALFVAHVFVAYFVSLPKLFAMLRDRPAAHPEAFAWMLGLTALFYVDFGLFREQFCVVMCPYGRLQSVLLDDDSLVVGYDERRGEPRAKRTKSAPAGRGEARGDCVDCNRCVVVCPTNIDIRDGLQLDCIACTACIDACDDVMSKLGRPRGLIRYDSSRGLRGEARRILRPRLLVYTGLLVLGCAVALLAFRKRDPFEANIVRLPGTPYTRDGDVLRNGFELHLVNKKDAVVPFRVEAVSQPELTFTVPIDHLDVDALASRRVPIFVAAEAARFTVDRPFLVRIHSGDATKEVRATFLGASASASSSGASTSASTSAAALEVRP